MGSSRTETLIAVLLSGWFVAGCYSADNFDECTKDEHCGAFGLCTGGTCDIVGSLPDARVGPGSADASTGHPPDTGNSERIILQGPKGDDPERHDGKTVVIRNVQVSGIPAIWSVTARVIIVEGKIDADGAGYPGGGGGGGGSAGSARGLVSPGVGGDSDAESGQDGRPNQSDVAGGGGNGGNGSGDGAGVGGRGGSPESVGGHGDDGRHQPHEAGDDVCGGPPVSTARPGSGGGGGGGGGGANGTGCGIGAGAGGGGAGAPGGGAIFLLATERIEFHGELTARGLAAASMPPDDATGHPACDCGAPCEADMASTNGQGGAGVSSDMGGTTGAMSGVQMANGRPAGIGGNGGGGGGGGVTLRAPEIVWGPTARVDLQGSAGMANAGVLRIQSAQPGVPPSEAAHVCLEP